MRISSGNDLSRENSNVREPYFKVFAMFEGIKTEVYYFESLFNSKKFANIEYLYYKKENNEKGWSNPQTLIDCIRRGKDELEKHTYDENIDKIILVVDRDELSFTKEQYEYVVRKSEENNVDFVLTNPCFEFYLLLHLSDGKDIDKKLLDNKIVLSLLKQYDRRYKKSKYDVVKYVKLYETAIKNAKSFETNIDLLMNNPGTNLGEWIEKILKKIDEIEK